MIYYPHLYFRLFRKPCKSFFLAFALKDSKHFLSPQTRKDNERDKAEFLVFPLITSTHLLLPLCKNILKFILFPIQNLQILPCIHNPSFYLHPILSLFHIFSFSMHKFLRRYQDFGCSNSILSYCKQCQIQHIDRKVYL